MEMAPRVAIALREQDPEKARAFARAFEDARRQAVRLTEQGVRAIRGVVNELRTEITARLARLAASPDQPFLVRLVPGIQNEINEALAEMIRRADGEIRDRLETVFELGSGVTARSFRAAGVPVAFPTVSSELLTSLTATATNVLSEASARLGARIMREIRLSAAGLEPASATIRRVADILRTSLEVQFGRRVRIGFAFQAEAIARTEISRLYSASQQAASELISEQVPTLRKRWVTSLRERRGHALVEQRYRVGGEIGPIPIKATFRVEDFSRSDFNRQGFWTVGGKVRPRGFTGGQRVFKGDPGARRGRVIVDQMLFPRDPAASPGNTVNCTCTTIDVVPEFEDVIEKVVGQIPRG